MTWTPPKTWLVDELVTAADMNAQIRDNLAHLDLCLRSYTSLRDEKTKNTHGGTFASGGWRMRDLNVKAGDPDGLVTLASHQFTLGPGTYIVHASAPAYAVSGHQARLQNITTATTVQFGTSEVAATTSGHTTRSIVRAVLTLTATETFEVQHWCNTTGSGTGFGYAINAATEVYTTVDIWRIA